MKIVDKLKAVTKKLNFIKKINIGGKPANCKINNLKTHPSRK
jgi:hypothetical protein